MNTPFDSDTLAAAEVCFAVASQLLYLEPEIAPVAEQVASRQFASAPFGEGNDDERQGLHLLDGWCAVALNASEVPEEASADEAAARLVESPAFAEAVAEMAAPVCRPGHARGVVLRVVLRGAQQPYVR